MANADGGSNRNETTRERPSRRTVLKHLGAGATASAGLAGVSDVAAGVQESGKLTITSVDPQNFPNITVSCIVDTEAGRRGEIPKKNFEVIEKLPNKPKQTRPIKGFEKGGGEAVDIVFAFDDSGSMTEEIETMKQKVTGLTDQIENAGIDARYGLVTFVDKKEHLENDTPQFTDASTLKNRVNGLTATSGDRCPERSFGGIMNALDFGFRSDALKVIISITDVWSHYKNDAITKYQSPYTLEQVATNLRERGINYVAVAPDLMTGTTFPAFPGCTEGTFTESDIRNGSTRILAQQVNGTWMSMSGDFSQVLDQIILNVRTTYKCTYETRAPARQNDSAGRIGMAATDPKTGRTHRVPPSDDGAGRLSVPPKVKEPADCTLPNGEPAVRDNIAVFLSETGEQLTSQNTDEQGTVNFDIPIENTQDRVDIVYYQIFDKDPTTTKFEFPLPDDKQDARIAGKTDGSPDLYAITRTTAAKTGGVVTVDLPEAYKLDVKVVDSSQNPVANRRVDVFHRDEDTGATGGLFAFTNSDGLMTIPEGDDTGIEVRGPIEVFVWDRNETRVAQSRKLDVVDGPRSVTLTVE